MSRPFRPSYDWTIMIYMTSNEKYSDAAARKFLKELGEIGQDLSKYDKNPRVKIILHCMTNWSPPHKRKNYYTRQYEIQPNFLHKKRIYPDIVNANMGDPNSLTDFIERCQEGYSAKKYMLFLWGHGTGVGMFDYDLTEARSNIKDLSSFTNAIINQKPPKFTEEGLPDDFIEKQVINTQDRYPTTLVYLNISKHKDLKKHLPSAVRLDSLTSREIRESLTNSFRRFGGKIDLVTILGCTMQMIEFGYEIRKHCKYLVASEELMWWQGYNYKKTFNRLFRNPHMDARELGISLVRDIPKKPTYSKNEKKEVAISCVDLSQSLLLANKIDELSKMIILNGSRILDLVAKARRNCFHFGEESFDSYIDATWFFKNLAHLLRNETGYTSIYKRSLALVKILQEDYVIEKYIGQGRRTDVKSKIFYGGHGVSIYFPFGRADERNNIFELSYPFKKGSPFKVKFVANSWNTLLDVFMIIIKGDPQLHNKRL